MNRKPAAARCCLYISLSFALMGIILRTVAMFTVFDQEVGYFDASLIATLLTVLSFAAALLPAGLALAAPKGQLPTVWPAPKHNAAASLPFILMGVGGAWQLWLALSDSSSSNLLLLSGVAALLSALYYFMTMAAEKAAAVPVLGFSPIVWALFSTAETYTDQFTTMNSPIKLGLQFGFLSVALLATAELRFRLNKPSPRTAIFIHCLALFFCLTGSVPTLAALAAGILARPIHGAYALSLLGVGLYAALRLIFYIVIPAPEVAGPEETADSSLDEGGTP